ncbi:MAG: terminase large subunit [Sciscionella sp.]
MNREKGRHRKLMNDYIVQPIAGETALKYAQDVLSGDIVAGRFVKLACKRFLDDLQFAEARGFYFDTAAAQHAADFFGGLKHTKGVWAKKRETAGFLLSNWQVFVIANLFGWLRFDNGQRRFREAHLELARKNGKSTFIAGIGNYMLVADGEPGAEVYSAATTRDQAKIVFNAAKDMVKVSPRLAAAVRVWQGSLTHEASSSKFAPVAADSTTLDGLNIHCALIDELHEHPTRSLYDVLNTATGSRSQPLVLAITTAGFTREGICWDQRTYGVKVISSITPDDNFFAFIATLDDGDDWKDEKNWCKANPNLGISVSLEAIRPNFIKALEQPAAQNEFLRKHLNVWTSADTAWLPDGVWEKNCEGGEHVEPIAAREHALLAMRGIPLVTKVGDKEITTYPQPRFCFGGLDIAECEDLVSFVLVFPPCERRTRMELKTDPVTKKTLNVERLLQEADSKWHVIPFFWIPEAFAEERAKKNRAPYDVWIRTKLIEKTPGNTVAQEAIRMKILEMKNLYTLGEVGYDNWGAEWIGPKLLADGIKMVKIPQRFEMLSAPTKSFSAFISTAQKQQPMVEHYNNPVLRWMASNVQLLLDSNGNQRPDKGKSKNKIDGIVATIMAVGRALANPAASRQDDPDRFKVRMI